MEAYLSRFFLHALTSEKRGEIIAFKQKEDESLYNAWERYKQLLRRCLMSAQNAHHIPTFYHVFCLFHLVISVFITLYLILGSLCISSEKKAFRGYVEI